MQSMMRLINGYVILTTAWFLLPPGGVWITDNGNKYMMMRNFAEGNGRKLNNGCPDLFPTGGFHFYKTCGGAYSFYPEYLSFITVPFYKLFGERGILFFPSAATLLLLFMVWRYWHIPPPLLLLSTPLFFYSLLLWEMTPSVFLITAVMLLAERKRFFAAGCVLGVSLLMREEAYFICGAMGAALLVCGRWRELAGFIGAFIIAALPVWLYQWGAYGHFLGNHGKYYYLNNNAGFTVISQLKNALFNYYHHLFRFDSWHWPALNLLSWSVLIPIAAGAAPGFRKWRKAKYGACIIYLAAMGVLAAGVWFRGNTVYTASMLTGLLTATPVIAGFLINWHAFLRCRKFRLLTLAALFYVVGVTAADIGLVWGSRHFLVLLPVLVYLSFCGFRLMGISVFSGKFKAERLIPAAALAVSIFIQCFGLYALFRVSGDSHAAESALLKNKNGVIVTDVFYIPEQMPRLFFNKTVLQVLNREDIRTLKTFFQNNKEKKEFLLVLSPQFRRMDDGVLKEFLREFPLTAPPERIRGAGGFPDLFAGNCRAR